LPKREEQEEPEERADARPEDREHDQKDTEKIDDGRGDDENAVRPAGMLPEEPVQGRGPV